MSTVVVEAPAKLTLSLRITGVRDDGYHLIDAEMVTLDWHDTLTIDASSSGLTAEGRYARSMSDGVRISGTNVSSEDRTAVSDKESANRSGSGGSRQRPRARTVTPRPNRPSIPKIANSRGCRSGTRSIRPMAMGGARATETIPLKMVAARSARRVVARNSDRSRTVSDRSTGLAAAGRFCADGNPRAICASRATVPAREFLAPAVRVILERAPRRIRQASGGPPRHRRVV